MNKEVGGSTTALLLVGTLAGVTGVIKDYPLYGGQAVRYLLGAVILLATARAMGLRLVRLTRLEALNLLALTLLGLVIFNICVVEATRASGPALLGTVLGTVPLILALTSGRPAPRLVVGASIVVVGATLATGFGTGNLPGLLWSLGAVVGEVSFSLLAIPLLPKLGAIRLSAYTVTLAVPMLALVGLLAEGKAMLRVPTLAETLGFLYLAVIITSVGFFIWYSSLSKLGPGTAGLFAGLIPVSAIA